MNLIHAWKITFETKTNTSKTHIETHIETHRHMSCTHHLYTLVVQILTPPLQQWLTNYGFSIFYLEIVLCLLFKVWMTLLLKRDANSPPPLMCTDKLVGLYICVEIWKLLKFNSSYDFYIFVWKYWNFEVSCF